jgi:hypothetical protein
MTNVEKITNGATRNLQHRRLPAGAKLLRAAPSPFVPEPYVPGLRELGGDGEPVGRVCARHLQHVLPDDSTKRRRRIPCRMSLL